MTKQKLWTALLNNIFVPSFIINQLNGKSFWLWHNGCIIRRNTPARVLLLTRLLTTSLLPQFPITSKALPPMTQLTQCYSHEKPFMQLSRESFSRLSRTWNSSWTRIAKIFNMKKDIWFMFVFDLIANFRCVPSHQISLLSAILGHFASWNALVVLRIDYKSLTSPRYTPSFIVPCYALTMVPWNCKSPPFHQTRFIISRYWSPWPSLIRYGLFDWSANSFSIGAMGWLGPGGVYLGEVGRHL